MIEFGSIAYPDGAAGKVTSRKDGIESVTVGDAGLGVYDVGTSDQVPGMNVAVTAPGAKVPFTP